MLDDAFTYFTVIRDGHAQNAVVRAIARNDAVRRQATLLVDTRAWPALSRHRSVTTAQLNCLMKDAFGDESHFAAMLSRVPFDWQADYALLNRYRNVGTCFRGWHGGAPALLTVTGYDVLPLPRLLKLSVLHMVSAERYGPALDAALPAEVSLTALPNGWLKNPH